ncbi:MAG: MaoC/PaaZ C-terminal domain-containing protein, partial [Rubrivivax sp.]|nr:MaoC/PaaZ C-terminal domain-containing protein [Rubrivivax sp.]
LTEDHDIVYREAPKAPTLSTGVHSLPPEGPIAASGSPSPLTQPGDPVSVPQMPPLEGQATWRRTIVPDDVLLFRYSALTFNGHRIHYDRKYVTEVEGYPGLIVHGPLIATLLMDLLRRNAPGAEVASFKFKAVRPTFDLNPFQVNGHRDGNTVKLWAQDHEGWLTMDAVATLKD